MSCFSFYCWTKCSIKKFQMLNRPSVHISVSGPPPLDSVTKTSTPSSSKNGKTAGQQGAPWETLVVFAINLKQLTVQMNMSNVMGNNT